MIKDLGKYYLYRHIRLDKNEPFYIGIGTKYGDKIYKTFKNEYYRAFDKINRGIIWKRVVNKSNYEVEILLESDSYEFIKEKEKEFIQLYGRIDLKTGILANMTDGGDGTIGAIRTEEWIKNISKGNKGKKVSKEHVDKLVAASTEYNKKKICQYTLEGRFIKIWDSIKEASEALNILGANIGCAARGISEYSGNFLWRFPQESGEYLKFIDPSERIKRLNNYHITKERLSKGIYKNKKPIEMIDTLSNIIKMYTSIQECEIDTKIKSFYLCRLLISGKIYKKQYKFNYLPPRKV